MAQSLGFNVEQAGSAVTLYVLGATFAAPILTALTAGWKRRSAMLMTVLVFTAGSVIAAMATSLSMLLIARFVAGMGHGLFLAVASSTAARLVGVAEERAPHAHGVAAGLYIAGFNSGIALGSWVGRLTLRSVGGAYTGLSGGSSVLGLLLLFVLMASNKGHNYKPVASAGH